MENNLATTPSKVVGPENCCENTFCPERGWLLMFKKSRTVRMISHATVVKRTFLQTRGDFGVNSLEDVNTSDMYVLNIAIFMQQ